jgi:hypothetical protein
VTEKTGRFPNAKSFPETDANGMRWIEGGLDGTRVWRTARGKVGYFPKRNIRYA